MSELRSELGWCEIVSCIQAESDSTPHQFIFSFFFYIFVYSV